MNNFNHLKKQLNSCIKVISNSRSLFVENPKSDFIRNRKLDFETVIKSIICMETGSIKDELLKLNDYSLDTPTSSAFVQARDKIKVDAFRSVFNIFNKRTSKLKTYKGYRLLLLMAVKSQSTILFLIKILLFLIKLGLFFILLIT